MKFNVEKLKQIARPMSEDERQELEYRQNNRDWLALSEKLALKISYFLRVNGMSKTEFASRMGVSSAQITKILSGKENLSLKTICKIEKALETKLLDVDIEDESVKKTVGNGSCIQVIALPVCVSSNNIKGQIQHTGSFTYFTSDNMLF